MCAELTLKRVGAAERLVWCGRCGGGVTLKGRHDGVAATLHVRRVGMQAGTQRMPSQIATAWSFFKIQ